MAKRLRGTPARSDRADAWSVDPALVVNFSPVPILTVGTDGRILTCNPAVEAMLGYESNELIDSSLDILLPHFRDEIQLERLEDTAAPLAAEQPPAKCCCTLAQHKDGT